eukprot:COSAG06_NODE_4406_length_4293_cov_2.302575_3_plen_91_part_00
MEEKSVIFLRIQSLAVKMPARQTMYGMLALQAFSNYVTRGALSPMIQCVLPSATVATAVAALGLTIRHRHRHRRRCRSCGCRVWTLRPTG